MLAGYEKGEKGCRRIAVKPGVEPRSTCESFQSLESYCGWLQDPFHTTIQNSRNDSIPLKMPANVVVSNIVAFRGAVSDFATIHSISGLWDGPLGQSPGSRHLHTNRLSLPACRHQGLPSKRGSEKQHLIELMGYEMGSMRAADS